MPTPWLWLHFLAVLGVQAGLPPCGKVIELDESVTEIPEGAYRNCTELEKLVLPGVVTVRADGFFRNSRLKTVHLPKVRVVQARAFASCSNLVTVELPLAVKLEKEAFYGCFSLQAITMPNVRSLDEAAFRACVRLKSVRLPNLVVVGDEAFRECLRLEAVVMPKVIEVRKHAFNRCTLLRVVDMPSVQSVHGGVFAQCLSLKTLELPKLIHFGTGCFAGCHSLEVASLPSVKEISAHAFMKCVSLRVVELGAVNVVEQHAFVNCRSLRSISLPNLTRLGDSAFLGCQSLVSVHLERVRKVGQVAFKYCQTLEDIIMPRVEEIGKDAFSHCSSIKAVAFPRVRQIGAEGFANCWALTEIRLPLLEEVGPWAFWNSSLSSIDLGEVHTVGERAFAECDRLQEVKLALGVALKEAAFKGLPALRNVTFDNYSSLESFWRATFDGKAEGRIGRMAFGDCVSLETIFLPGRVRMEERAFAGCTGLKSVTLHSVEHVGFEAFQGCSSLHQVVFIGNRHVELDNYAFQGCTKLQHVSLPTGLQQIGSGLFSGCHLLEQVDLPQGLARISWSAFAGCFSLQRLCTLDANGKVLQCGDEPVLPSSVRTIEPEAFAGCAKLPSLLALGLQSIGDRAFADCKRLRTIGLSSGLRSIGASAFEGCLSMHSITVPESVQTIGRGAFQGCSSLETANIWKSHLDELDTAMGKGCCKRLSRIVFKDSVTTFKVNQTGCSKYRSVEDDQFFKSKDHCEICPPDPLGVRIAILSMLLLALLLGGRTVVSLQLESAELAGAVAAKSVFWGTLQVVQVIILDVPWPQWLEAILNIFVALGFESLHAECALTWSPEAKAWLILFGLPVTLGFGHVLLLSVNMVAVWRTGAKISLQGRLKNMYLAWVSNLYCLMLMELGVCWKWVAHTVWRGTDDRLIGLSAAFFIYQVMLPCWLLYHARHPSVSFATAPYREQHKRSWMIVEVVFASVLVSSTSLVQRRLVRARILFSLLSVRTVLLVKANPYKPVLMTTGAGSLFHTILVCEMTKFCFAGAALALVRDAASRGAEDENQATVLLVSVLLLASLTLWLCFFGSFLWSEPALRAACKSCWERTTHLIPAESSAEDSGRQDLGTFRAGAHFAVISAPGTAPRSWRVLVQPSLEESPREAVLVKEPGVRRPPMLKNGCQYRVLLSHSWEEVEIEGSKLSFAGEAEYEFWNNAINRIRYVKGYSFACVWVPGIKGHCRPADSFEEWLHAYGHTAGVAARPGISDEAWNRYQASLPWIHQQLAAGYRFRGSMPECENCGWFDLWAINVIRCYESGQRLLFAFLQDPLYDLQPKFLCTAPGRPGTHYVGIAQKVELEWAQNQMGMVVEPVTLQDLPEADDEEMRIVGKAVAAAGESSSELHTRLGFRLGRMRLARMRRRLLGHIMRCLPLLPLGLGILSLLLATTKGGNSDAAVVGVVALLAALGSFRLQRGFFSQLDELFDQQDQEDADRFTKEVEARLDARGAVLGSNPAEEPVNVACLEMACLSSRRSKEPLIGQP